MNHIKSYKKFICEQFNLSKKDVLVLNDRDVIKEIEKQYKMIIKTKEDIVIEKIIKNDKLIRNRPVSLENIYTSAVVLIITIMLGVSSCFLKEPIIIYNTLLSFVVCCVMVVVFVKVYEHNSTENYCGYLNMCLMILDKIEKEIEYKSSEEETNKNEKKINQVIKEITDIKDFIGIR